MEVRRESEGAASKEVQEQQWQHKGATESDPAIVAVSTKLSTKLMLPMGALNQAESKRPSAGFAPFQRPETRGESDENGDEDDDDGESVGPLMSKEVSARSRSGDHVVCPPGLKPPADLPSRGSMLHAGGDCQPCAWFWRPGSCLNGKDCGHCHLCPVGEIKARKKKKHAMMRLGLATPKPGSAAAGAAAAEDGGAGPSFLEPCKVNLAMSHTFSEFSELGPDGSPHEASSAAVQRADSDLSMPRKVTFAVTHAHTEGGPRAQRRARLAEFLEEEEAAFAAKEQAKSEAQPAADPEPEAPEEPSAFFPPGLKPQAPMPSRGSALHGTGQCRPCAWFWRPGSCQNEADCGHCHLCGEGELKNRKKAKQAMLRLGLATPKPAANADSEQEALRQALSLAASFGEEKRGRPSSSGSEQESTTASSSELEDETSSASKEAGPNAKSRIGALVRLPPGLKAPPGTPSHGSSLHRVGNCWPCAHFWKPRGCPNQEDCPYCHLCPEGEMKTRKRSKQAMMRLGLATPKASSAAQPDDDEQGEEREV